MQYLKNPAIVVLLSAEGWLTASAPGQHAATTQMSLQPR